MPKTAGTKKKQEIKPKREDQKTAKGVKPNAAPVLAAPWEPSLLEVYGGNVSLSYPRRESGAVSMEYGLSPAAIPLQEGITVRPSGALGQVSTYDDAEAATRSVIFNAADAEVEFAPPNLKGNRATGRLAVITLVSEQPLAFPHPAAQEGPVMDRISLPPLEQAGLETQSGADAPKSSQRTAPLNIADRSPEQSPSAGETEISASLADPLVIQLAGGFRLELDDAAYRRHKHEPDPRMTFRKTRLTCQNQPVTPDFETESDHSGLHLSGDSPISLDETILAETGLAGAPGQAQKAELRLDQEGASITQMPDFEGWQSGAEPELQRNDEEELKLDVEAEEPQHDAEKAEKNRDLFTDDGFLQLEHPQYDSQSDGEGHAETHGTGSFRFLRIPYDIIIPRIRRGGQNSHLRGVTRETDREGEIDFTLSADGKINATFSVPVELSMQKAGVESESVIKTLTLMDAAIENNVLTAKNVRIDRGSQLKQDLDDHAVLEDARELFGVSLKGTIADVGGSVTVNRERGITGETGKKQLGAFEVSDFLGFLDVSGDYAAGTLHAALHTDAEDEKEQSSHLLGESRHRTEAGLSIPIAGPLSFEFAVGTSLKIGGELSADLARDPPKSFGEDLEPNETMALKGGLRLESAATVDLFAGLAVGIPAFVTNLLAADLMLKGELGAAFETELTGGTALGIKNEKLKQVEDLKLDGNLDVTLNGALSLNSDVKFLIWRANIFTLELWKKEIQLARVSGTVTRDAGTKGLKNGWHFEPLDLSAEAFGKKAGLALKNQPQPKPEPLEVTKAAAEALGSNAMGAWAVLEDLKRQQTLNGNRAYFLEEEDQKTLNENIQKMTETVQKKLTDYVAALASYQEGLRNAEKNAKNAVDAARKEQITYQQKDEVQNLTLWQGRIGGFDPENYRNTPEQPPLSETEMEHIRAESDSAFKANSQIREENRERERSSKGIREKNRQRSQMAAIDLAIARQLGIYDSAMIQAKDDYDVFAEVENRKRKAENKDIPEKNLYRMSSTMTDDEFLTQEHLFWGTGERAMNRLTQFGSGGDSYFKAMFSYAIRPGKNREGYGIYGKAFRVGPGSDENAFTNMSGYDLLKIILTDTYPKGAHTKAGVDRSGQKIGGTPEQKLEALNHLFEGQKRENMDSPVVRLLLDCEKKKTRQEAMLDDSNEVYRTLFDSTVQEMASRGTVNIPQKLEELNGKLEASREHYLQAVQEHLDIQATMRKVQAEQADCLAKLKKLEKNAETGIALNETSVAGATGAVDFMEQEYQEIISGKRLLDAAAENPKSQKVLERAGASAKNL